jgi:uncharacterized protein (DUF2147 family)
MLRCRRLTAILCCAVLLCAVRAGAASSAQPLEPSGVWLTASGHGVVEIAACGDALCGRIVGIDRAPGDPMPTDAQGRSQCGLTIITNERPSTGSRWLGWVTDPRNGATYRAELWVDKRGNLNLRGFIGVPLLGETQVWHRFTGRLTADCGLREHPI